jgi:hypothetical protein
MGTKHKHYDVIVAWAAGEEIQYFWGFEWRDWEETSCPAFAGTAEWRIKPKRVKKEGWVNVYPGNFLCYFHSKVHADKSDEVGKDKRVACVHIEWEEEE